MVIKGAPGDNNKIRFQDVQTCYFVYGKEITSHRNLGDVITYPYLGSRFWHTSSFMLILQIGAHFTKVFLIFRIWITIEHSFYSHPSCSELVTMKFCTWHESCAVVACAKFLQWCNLLQWSYAETNLPLNLNYVGKIINEMGPIFVTFLCWYKSMPRHHLFAKASFACQGIICLPRHQLFAKASFVCQGIICLSRHHLFVKASFLLLRHHLFAKASFVCQGIICLPSHLFFLPRHHFFLPRHQRSWWHLACYCLTSHWHHISTCISHDAVGLCSCENVM